MGADPVQMRYARGGENYYEYWFFGQSSTMENVYLNHDTCT